MILMVSREKHMYGGGYSWRSRCGRIVFKNEKKEFLSVVYFYSLEKSNLFAHILRDNIEKHERVKNVCKNIALQCVL